jgi:hypothetical protein
MGLTDIAISGEVFSKREAAEADALANLGGEAMSVFQVGSSGRQGLAINDQCAAEHFAVECELDADCVAANLYARPLSTHSLYPLTLMRTWPSGARRNSRPSSQTPASILRLMALAV